MKKIDFQNILIENFILKNHYQLGSLSIINQFCINTDKIIPSKRTMERWLKDISWLYASNELNHQIDHNSLRAKKNVFRSLINNAKKNRRSTLFVQINKIENLASVKSLFVLAAVDGKGSKRWCCINSDSSESLLKGLIVLANNKKIDFFFSGELTRNMLDLKDLMLKSNKDIKIHITHFHQPINIIKKNLIMSTNKIKTKALSHLDCLEAESMHIIREVMAFAKNPVMLYSIGKDSAVMLHLAQKAFHPSPPPFPLLHVDTRWKFKAMYEFRDMMAKKADMDLKVHINEEGVKKNINPLDHGSAIHTEVMKTQGLKQALDQHQYDFAFGGARRDEEKSRAKERIFSFRNANHVWDPKNQRPELWNLYNCRKSPGESVRVFPLSNWTELDIWQYIYREDIPIVPLYFAAERPVINRNDMLIMVDDNRISLLPGESIETKCVRFRTLGCYPLTGAVESSAFNIAEIILELLNSKTSERQGRAIDADENASMEKKKQEGYF